MRVALVALRFQAPGGVESNVEAVATRLARRGHEVTVFASDLYDEGRWERRSAWPAAPEGIVVRRFPAVKRLLPGITMPMMPGLIDALVESNPDVVHAHSHRYGHVLQAGVVAERTGTPLVASTHYHPADRRERMRNRLLLRGQDHLFGWTAYRVARALVVESRREAGLVAEFAPRVKIRVIPPGVDLAEWSDGTPSSQEALPGLPSNYLLYAGRIASNKGLAFLFRTLGSIPPGDRPHLVLMGRDWGERPRLDELAVRLGIDNQLVWLGNIEDRASYRAVFRGASALVLPSEWEAYGLVLLEAMAAGVSVVATAVGGVPELLEEGKCGWLVPYGDVPAMREALRLARVPSPEREARRDAASHRVRGMDWNRSVMALEGLYASLPTRALSAGH